MSYRQLRKVLARKQKKDVLSEAAEDSVNAPDALSYFEERKNKSVFLVASTRLESEESSRVSETEESESDTAQRDQATVPHSRQQELQDGKPVLETSNSLDNWRFLVSNTQTRSSVNISEALSPPIDPNLDLNFSENATSVTSSADVNVVPSNCSYLGSLLLLRRELRHHTSSSPAHLDPVNPVDRRCRSKASHRRLNSSVRFQLYPAATADNWPRHVGDDQTLFLDQISTGKSPLCFELREPAPYAAVKYRLIKRIKKGLENDALLDVLRQHPFHWEANVLWVLTLLNANQTDLAFTTCRRAVHALQCSLHPKFAPHKFDPNAMPPWPQIRMTLGGNNTALFCGTLLLYARLLSHFSAYGPALEILKLLLLIDPEVDVCHALLHIDYCFVQLRRVAYFHAFSRAFFRSTTHLFWGSIIDDMCLYFPNFAFSAVLVRLQGATKVCLLPVASFFSVDPSEKSHLAPTDYCVFTADSPPLCDRYTGVVPYASWVGAPGPRAAQLFLLRSLVVFPHFVFQFVRQLQLDLNTVPPQSRSAMTWKELTESEAFRSFYNRTSTDLRGTERVTRFAVRLTKLYLVKHEALWKSAALISYVHEGASLVAQHYCSPSKVPSAAFGSENLTAVASNSWSYKDVIQRFRDQWMSAALQQFHQSFALTASYVNASEEECTLIQLPSLLAVEIMESAKLYQPSQLGLPNSLRPPFLWLSLASSPILLFIVSLLPRTMLDIRGGL